MNTEIADYVEPIKGFRAWVVSKKSSEHKLYSPYRQSNENWSCWQQTTASCKKPNAAHVAPHKSCSCGIYAYHTKQQAQKEAWGISQLLSPQTKRNPYFGSVLSGFKQSPSFVVVGSCKMWGKAEVHDDGIRSQHAIMNKQVTLLKQKNFFQAAFWWEKALAFSILALIFSMFVSLLFSVWAALAVWALIAFVDGLVLYKNLPLAISQKKEYKQAKKWLEQNGFILVGQRQLN